MINLNPKGKFGNYLYSRFHESKKHIAKFANDIGVCSNTIQRHINGINLPNMKTALLYSDGLNVSLNYIIELINEDIRSFNRRHNQLYGDVCEPKGEFGKLLFDACISKDRQLYLAASKMGLVRQTISMHISMKAIPRYQTILIYSEYLGIDKKTIVNMIHNDWKEMENLEKLL